VLFRSIQFAKGNHGKIEGRFSGMGGVRTISCFSKLASYHWGIFARIIKEAEIRTD
jgi:hypothetical protein